MKKISILATAVALSSFPLVTSAALEGVRGIILNFGAIVKLSIPILGGLALLVFFWGLVKFIWSASEGDIDNGKTLMIWGIAALFVMMAIWGIIHFIGRELGTDTLSNQGGPIIPNFSNQF